MQNSRTARTAIAGKVFARATQKRGFAFAGGFFLFLVLALVFSSPSFAGSYGVFPACDTPTVEKRIVERFNWAEEKQWQRGFTMARLTRMHEHRTLEWKDSDILRRYCMATAHFSNGTHRNVYFLIEDNGGFAGFTWGLTYCVSGLDPWRNLGAHCQSVR